jgi:hypothetical protein
MHIEHSSTQAIAPAQPGLIMRLAYVFAPQFKRILIGFF